MPKRIETVVVSTQHCARREAQAAQGSGDGAGGEEVAAEAPARRQDQVLHQPHRSLRDRWSVRRRRPHRPQDHRRHLRRHWAVTAAALSAARTRRKVDRSACYYARYVAKNIVASGAARECEVQVAYAIGVAQPTGIYVNTFGTGAVEDEKLAKFVAEKFDFRPRALIEELDLLRPIYRPTSAYGHFGRSEFSWEKTDRAAEIAQSTCSA